jgi:hypothetical protein
VGLAVRLMELNGLRIRVRMLKEESHDYRVEYRAFERARRG